jgi:excinuclease UvrABC ATPase subunit
MKKLLLEDASINEIVEELKNRARISCKECNGFGYIVHDRNHTNETREGCKNCNGTGYDKDYGLLIKIRNNL